VSQVQSLDITEHAALVHIEQVRGFFQSTTGSDESVFDDMLLLAAGCSSTLSLVPVATWEQRGRCLVEGLEAVILEPLSLRQFCKT
jgi:hypothetical protein